MQHPGGGARRGIWRGRLAGSVLRGCRCALGLEPIPNLHAPFLAGVRQPQLASGIRYFQQPIPTTRVFLPVQRQTGPDHLGGQVTAIRQIALRNRAAMIVRRHHFRPHGLTLAQGYQGIFRVLAIRMVKFRRIDPEQANLVFWIVRVSPSTT